MILHFRVIHPHLEDDWLEACTSWELECLHQSQNIMDGYAYTVDDDPVWEDSVGDDKQPLQRDHPAELPTLMGAVDGPCSLTPDNTTDSMCYGFLLLPIEDPQVMASSAEELPGI